jgi:hypothetical protein
LCCVVMGGATRGDASPGGRQPVGSLGQDIPPPLPDEGYREFLNNARKTVGEVDQAMVRATPTFIPANVPQVVSHVRAEGGIPFPKQEEVVFEPFEFKTPTPDPNYVPWEGPKYKRPGRCDRANTEKIPLSINGAPMREEGLLDQIYLSEDLVPVDAGEVFGSHASLIPYGPSSGDGVYVHMETDNVPCVPFRIRITTTTMYRQSGNDALRNYDKKLSGEGEFHSWIQQKLFGKK